MGNATDIFRQARIWDTTDHKRAVLTEIAHMLLHLLRPRGAVEAENIDGKGLQNRHHGGDIRSNQHRAGGFHRHRDHQGAALARDLESLLDTE